MHTCEYEQRLQPWETSWTSDDICLYCLDSGLHKHWGCCHVDSAVALATNAHLLSICLHLYNTDAGECFIFWSRLKANEKASRMGELDR